MKIIICIGKNKEMMFNNRRVSQDSVVRKKMLEIANGNRLLMSVYSSKQFENTDALCVCDEFLKYAKDDDFCFVENDDIDINKVDTFYLFNWNRDYPGDVFFNFDLLSEGFELVFSEKFKGSSHDEVILEIFKRS